MKLFSATGCIVARFIAVSICITSVCVGISPAYGNAKWLDEFAQNTRQDAISHNIPGYTFVFVEKGKPASIYTFGKTEKGGQAINYNTVFRLASVSKTFTSALMAKMVENRKLNWQTSISTLAPEFGFSQAGMDGLNLEHLLGQSSGYSPNAYDNLIEANYPLRRVLNKLADLDPLCSPGQCYTYQNALFGVIEHYFQSNNSSYRHELDNYIFKPLAMPNASAGKAALISGNNWAKPHIAMTKKSWRKGSVKNSYYRFSPAAGVNASIVDMEVWIRAMLGEYPHQFSDGMVEKLTTPVVKTRRELNRRQWKQHLKDAHYGLGWRIYNFNGHQLNYHGGWVQGYRADVAFAPEQQVGFAMLMNAESNLINRFSADFWAAYFAHSNEQQQVTQRNIAALRRVAD